MKKLSKEELIARINEVRIKCKEFNEKIKKANDRTAQIVI